MRSPVAGSGLAKPLTLLILALGFVAVLVANLPGQLSYDSVLQLHDGRTGAYNSWHPPIMAWLLGLGVAAVCVTAGLAFVADAALMTRRIDVLGPVAQLRALQGYDIIGAVSHDPKIDLAPLGSPALAQRWRDAAAKAYTPERMDPLYDALEIGKVSAVPNAAVAKQWRVVVTGHPQAFLQHRWDVFRWTLLTPVLTRCLPVWAGVDGPANLLEDLNLVEQQRPQDEALEAYATRFYGSPVFSHVFYGLVAIVALLLLARFRGPGDAPIAFMLLSALGFAASFALISLACDYRYLYFLDLAAMIAVFHLALGRRSG